MAQWKFQFLPGTPDLVGTGFRMDAVGQGVEDEVNDALPSRFKFHGITKVVIKLGRCDVDEATYMELLSTAQLHLPTFELRGGAVRRHR